MNKNKLPKRKSIHLKNFDYKGNSYVYYVTICTFQKNNYFKDERLAKLIESDLLNWVKTFKRYTSKIIKEKYEINDLWQRGFYEHVL